jgi:hypothetical protein
MSTEVKFETIITKDGNNSICVIYSGVIKKLEYVITPEYIKISNHCLARKHIIHFSWIDNQVNVVFDTRIVTLHFESSDVAKNFMKSL